MNEEMNSGLENSSRRNVLRGSMLASAAAIVSAVPNAAISNPATASAPAAAPAHEDTEKVKPASNAKPANLSGYTRVKQALVAPRLRQSTIRLPRAAPRSSKSSWKPKRCC